MLSLDQVKQSLPSHLRSAATQALVDKINQVSTDPMVADYVKENFISYTHVLKEGKFKTEDYVSAVTYVSYKLMGNSNQDAWCKTFPQRHSTLVSNGADKKTISSHVAAYAKNKLVNLILEQSIIPSWILNQDVYQEAINTQASLMRTAQSEMVRFQAANSLLQNLAKPKEVGPLINIDMRESSGIQDLKKQLFELAEAQSKAIDGGIAAREIAAMKIIDLEDV